MQNKISIQNLKVFFLFFVKKNVILQCIVFILLCFFSFFEQNISFAEVLQENQTFLEADYLKRSNDNFFANGHVILKRLTMLINTDELEGIKEIKAKQKEMELNDKLKKIDEIDGKVNDNQNEKYKFYAKNWVKIRTDDDNIVFAKSMFYNENTGIGKIYNAQVYPGQKHNHTELYSTQLDKIDCIYTTNNATICPCKLFLDSNVENNRKNQFLLMDDDDELLEKPIEKNAIDNSDEEMHQKLRNNIISVKADKIIYDSEEHLMTLKKMWLKILGIPVFYFPTYSMHTDDEGDSGVLMPQFIILGTRQIGVELPLYWKIRPNMDILASRTQYFETGLGKYQYPDTKDNAYKLKDLSRYRESSTQIRFRHLISTNNAYENFYRIEAMMTDRTQMVNNQSGLGKTNDDGDKVMGYRWMIDFRTRMKMSKTTFLKADINWASDKNLAYYYKFDPRQIQENKIHLYDVAQNRYLSLELLNYQSRLLSIDDNTTPLFFPIIRANYDFKKDKLGGHFYFKSKTYYINRKEGFNIANVGMDFGYHLPFFNKFGTKFTFDAMLREVYNNTSFNEYSQISFAPFQYYFGSSHLLYFGNYGGMLQNNHYIYSDYRKNSLQTFGFTKFQVEHQFVLYSFFGKTIITPKMAIKYAPNSRQKHLSPVEDNLFARINYLNIFDLTQSDGYGVYDVGGSYVYGLDLKHRFIKNIEIFGGISQNMRLGGALDEEFLAEYTGYRMSMSDIMAHFGAKLYNFSASGYLNYDNSRNEIRIFGARAGYANQYLSLHVSYNSFSKYATSIGAGFDSLGVMLIANPTTKLNFIANMSYNSKGVDTQYGWKKGGITYYSIGAYYTISCLKIGFTLSRNLFSLTNIPNDIVYRFKFAFTGIG